MLKLVCRFQYIKAFKSSSEFLEAFFMEHQKKPIDSGFLLMS